MSNVTPPAPAAEDRVTVNVNVVVPELPSLTETSLTERLGVVVEQKCSGESVLRGVAAAAVKSAALLSVSVQPSPARKIAFVVLGAGARPAPSKQSGVVP